MYPRIADLPPPLRPPCLIPFDGFFKLRCAQATIATSSLGHPIGRFEFDVEDYDVTDDDLPKPYLVQLFQLTTNSRGAWALASWLSALGHFEHRKDPDVAPETILGFLRFKDAYVEIRQSVLGGRLTSRILYFTAKSHYEDRVTLHMHRRPPAITTKTEGYDITAVEFHPGQLPLLTDTDGHSRTPTGREVSKPAIQNLPASNESWDELWDRLYQTIDDPYVAHRKYLEARGIESSRLPVEPLKVLAPIDHPDYV